VSKFGDIIGATIHVLLGKDKASKKNKKNVISNKQSMSKEDIAAFYADKNKEKELATKEERPWVDIVGFEVDYENLSFGNFNFDRNELFISRLRAVGYQGQSDDAIMDQWFTSVCRNIALETYEQVRADPTQSKKLDNSRREYK